VRAENTPSQKVIRNDKDTYRLMCVIARFNIEMIYSMPSILFEGEASYFASLTLAENRSGWKRSYLASLSTTAPYDTLMHSSISMNIPINTFELVLTPMYETLTQEALEMFDQTLDGFLVDEVIKTISSLGPTTVSMHTLILTQSVSQLSQRRRLVTTNGSVFIQIKKIVRASFPLDGNGEDMDQRSGLDISTNFLNDIVDWIFNENQVMLNLGENLKSFYDFQSLESVQYLGFIAGDDSKRGSSGGKFGGSMKQSKLTTVIVLFAGCILMAVCILCYVNSTITRKQKRQRKQVERLRRLLRK